MPVSRLGGDRIGSHLGAERPLDPAFVERLRSACPHLSSDDAGRADAGRDWWPLAVRWALDGEVPAVPGVVARPADAAQVAAVLALCTAEGVAVTPAGGRSGVCGGAVPVFGGVALDLCGLSGIAAVDDTSLLVDVAAGMFGDHLEAELREHHGLTLGHWPQSIAMSTVGGWLACRSAGQYSTRYGKIEDMVAGLEVALADGRLVRTGGAGPRSAAGPDLTQLFVGSEGTLGVITEARLKAHPLPPAEQRAAYTFATMAAGLDACRHILRRGATPAVLRLYDEVESRRNLEVTGGCALIALDEGDPALVAATMAVVDGEARAAGGAVAAVEAVGRWLARRNHITSLEELAQGGVVADTIEVAAPWRTLTTLYTRSVAALHALEGTIAASAHQSHAYPDGACLYFTFAATATGEAADAYYRRAWDTVTEITLGLGGSLSHHHGVGLNRGRHMAAALGSAWGVLEGLKATLDPAGILNPGKLGLPSPFGPPPWPR